MLLRIRFLQQKFFLPLLLLWIMPPVYAQHPFGYIDSTLLSSPGFGHYVPEYAYDVSAKPEAWTKVAPGLHAAFGSTDALYFRTEVPPVQPNADKITLTGWKGERLNCQLVIWSPDTLTQVRVSASGLKTKDDRTLPGNSITINMVRYVIANFPYGSLLPDCSPSPYKNGFLMPDRFEAFDRFDLPGKTVRPVWISVNIPANLAAGTYRGTIEVLAKGSTGQKLNLEVKVQPQQLPTPAEWHYRLDLWQNPWVIADYYRVKPWSKEHLALLKKHMQLYAGAGGKFITTYGVHSPWGDNEYAIEGGMIEWIKSKSGQWKFDYRIFDQYVQAMMDLGINKAITVYTPTPWGDRVFYTDEATGVLELEQWPTGSGIYRKNWNIFLDDLKKHLTQKGWLSKAYLGINENAMEQTLSAIKMIKENWSGWKITYAGNWHPELDGLLDDYCFLYGHEGNTSQVKARAARGKTTTYYVCCNPAKPNNFLFSPPVEGRWQGWYAAAHGYNGFLRWAYDAWPADPLRDARYGTWAAGDCYLVYPGGNSCIRFEKLREGIVDYEKIRILRERVKKSSKPAALTLLKELDALLTSISENPNLEEAKLQADLNRGKELLDKISGIL